MLSFIKWFHELGFDLVDFELNAKRVMDNVINQQPNESNLGIITLECNPLLPLYFRNSHVKFVRTQDNEVAPTLDGWLHLLVVFTILSVY